MPRRSRSARPSLLPRGREIALHRHEAPYATLVLAGRYEEAGDAGRHVVEAGDVLLHAPFSAHRDVVAPLRTSVLDLPLPLAAFAAEPLPARGRLLDADAVARAAERDPEEARALLLGALVPEPGRGEHDLVDELGMALAGDQPPVIGGWADAHGRARETISRGFQRLYGASATAYRAEARARRAWRAIVFGTEPLVGIALATGHADQAHMTRAVRALTGRTPGAWRRLASHGFKTEREPAR